MSILLQASPLLAMSSVADAAGDVSNQPTDRQSGLFAPAQQPQPLPQISLAAGWNLLSIPTLAADTAPEAVLAEINGAYNVVYAYDGCNAVAPWQVYDAAGAPASNDLLAIDHTMGFWIEATAETTLAVTGTVPATTTLPLCQGWNLIGLPLAQARPVASALASITGKYTRVFGYDGTNPLNPWAGYDTNAPDWANDLHTLQPGRGYWLYATEDTPLLLANAGPPPTVEITSPPQATADMATLTTFTNITGTVNSNLLQEWQLRYRPQGETAWTTLVTGTTPVTEGVLGQFDPTLLLNGMYEIELTAVDFAGQTASDAVMVMVDGAQKIGHFSLSFVDVSVPVLGIPIEIVRTYDSRDKATGDFGAGWTMSVHNVRVQESSVLGEGWQVAPGSGFEQCLQPAQLHIVAVVVADEVFRFRPTLDPPCEPFAAPDLVEIGFEPLPGTQATLAPMANNLAIVLGGELLVDGSPVDFSDYRFTLPGGLELEIEQGFGLRRMADLNGNSLTIDENGVTHSSGVGIGFERDNQGRIVQITDPLSYTVTYDYDANGDLIAVTNQVSETTGFTYLADHYLHTIINPDGVEVAAVDYNDDGRLTQACDFENNCSHVSYNLSNNQETITDATNRTTVITYDDRGNVTAVADNAGHTTNFAYDEDDNLLQISDPNGLATRYTYDEEGNRLTATTPHNPTGSTDVYTTTYTYNSRNQLTSVTQPTGAQTVLVYDASGNLEEVKDGDDNQLLTYTYGAGGVVTSESTPFGTFQYGDFDAFGNAGVMTDTFGTVTTFTYDAAGQLATTTDSGLMATYTFDGLGRNTSIADNTGFFMDFGYGYNQDLWTSANAPAAGSLQRLVAPNGRLDGWTLADGTQLLFDYDAAGRLEVETDPAGNTTQYSYDAAGRPETIHLPTGGSQSLAYDPGGRVIQSTNELSHTTQITYGDDGRAAVITDTLGHPWTFSRTLTSTTSIDPLGQENTVVYSAEGLPVRYINPDNTSVQIEYLLAHPLLEAADYPTRIIDEGNHERLYTYTSLGQLQSATDLAGAVYDFDYEGAALISVTNPINEAITFTYDDNANIASVTYPDGGTRYITSTVSGDPLTITQPSGTTIHYTYDEFGNQTTRAASTGESHTFAYEPAGTLTQTTDSTGATFYQYDQLGQLEEISYPNGMRIHYGYDVLGQVVTVTTQISSTAPAHTTTYGYDARGNLTHVTDPLNGMTTMAYDAAGRLVTTTLPSGVTSVYTYNSRNQIAAIVHRDGTNNVLASATYERQGIGEPTRITREDGSYVILSYDGTLRLTGEDYYGADDTLLQSTSYAYDAVGNRQVMTNTAGVHTHTYDAGSRLAGVSGPSGSETYGHDADGRLSLMARDGFTHTLSYDSRDHLISFDGSVNYTYDALDRRVSAADASGERHFLVAPMAGQELESPYLVTDADGNLLSVYVYANGHPLMRFDATGSPTYYLPDAMGSILALADETGNGVASFHYDSFGNLREASGSAATPSATLGGDFRFHGAWLETVTGLYHFRARDYDPRTGRFLSRDAADPVFERPETFNPYVFALSNPHVYRDPSGFFSLVSISVSQSIQSTLRQLPRAAFRLILDQAKDEVGGIVTQALTRMFSSLLGFSRTNLPNITGGIFENTSTELVCGVLDSFDAAQIMWLEVPMNGGTGKPLDDGLGCSDSAEDRKFYREQMVNPIFDNPPNPDFLVSKFRPTELERRSGRPHSYLVGDFKLTVGRAYEKWHGETNSPKQGQWSAMINHAKNYEYYPVMMLVSWSFGQHNGTNGETLGRKMVWDIGRTKGVYLVIVVLKD
ncbi:MAG: hypothetical protein KJ069_29035 [Anaerolineae bacterium]|nr:hypothetical protein [Anaerolineae bacterium]